MSDRSPVSAPVFSPLWRGEDLASVLSARLSGAVPGAITGLSIDTRTLEPGALFFAIKGDARDGHEFVRSAFEKGAAAAVVDEAHAGAGSLLIVPDVQAALERMGRAGRARMGGAVIAITGSVGKTSTKEMMALAFSRQGKTHAAIASYNNHWGVPLTLGRMPADAAYGVFEVGMNHPFEILPLTAMVRPHVALVTTVEPVHLAQFRSIDGIADAKGEIFMGLEPGGVAIINGDNPRAGRLAAHAGASRAGRVIRFGAGEGCDVHLKDVRLDPDFSLVSAEVFGIPVTYRLGAPGRHLALNSLAVLGAVHVLGGDLAMASLAMQDFTLIDGRGKRILLDVGGKPFTLIDESYNANPSSMRAAFAVTGSVPRGARGRRIAVLGDMLELGPEGPALHAALASAIPAHEIDLVYAAGPLMKNLYQALPADHRGAYAECVAELESLLPSLIHPGDVVMVKGSNGSRISRVVSALKSRFPIVGAATDEL
jgi:UDP-N-acetylmuramoyl-tripeptide--D-alanyl-D-alanine ligase